MKLRLSGKRWKQISIWPKMMQVLSCRHSFGEVFMLSGLSLVWHWLSLLSVCWEEGSLHEDLFSPGGSVEFLEMFCWPQGEHGCANNLIYIVVFGTSVHYSTSVWAEEESQTHQSEISLTSQSNRNQLQMSGPLMKQSHRDGGGELTDWQTDLCLYHLLFVLIH